MALRVLCAEYLCGYLAEGGEDGVLVRRVSRLAARYTVIKINAYGLAMCSGGHS